MAHRKPHPLRPGRNTASRRPSGSDRQWPCRLRCAPEHFDRLPPQQRRDQHRSSNQTRQPPPTRPRRCRDQEQPDNAIALGCTYDASIEAASWTGSSSVEAKRTAQGMPEVAGAQHITMSDLTEARMIWLIMFSESSRRTKRSAAATVMLLTSAYSPKPACLAARTTSSTVETPSR